VGKVVIIYVKPDCPYCAAATRELESRGDPYKTVDIHSDRTGWEELSRLTGGTMVVPVTVEDNGTVRYTFGSG
jgi:glutaredoxin